MELSLLLLSSLTVFDFMEEVGKVVVLELGGPFANTISEAVLVDGKFLISPIFTLVTALDKLPEEHFVVQISAKPQILIFPPPLLFRSDTSFNLDIDASN
jgi:hypothetical protein